MKPKRRAFLETVGATLPATRLASLAVPAALAASSTEKFTTLDLSSHYNASAVDFGPRERAKQWADPETLKDGLIRTPGGAQAPHGIPFVYGPADVRKKSWVILNTRDVPWATRRWEIPIAAKASHVCFAQFCDWDASEVDPASPDVMEKVGQKLALAVLVYEDGTEHSAPIRRRFEVGSATLFNNSCYAAVHSNSWGGAQLEDAWRGTGDWSTAMKGLSRKSVGPAKTWIWAFENPHPDRQIKALRLEAVAEDSLAICALTLFRGRRDPLIRERLRLYRITLPSATAHEKDRWSVDVDLGVIGRTYTLGEFKSEEWLSSPGAGLGEKRAAVRATKDLFVELTASPDATISVRDTKKGVRYDFDLAGLDQGAASRPAGARIEFLEREKVWVHGRVLDAEGGQPTPVRLAFRAANGRYIPPYGHRTEVDTTPIIDNFAELKLGESCFAYVDGTFQVELPTGDAYVEISKGFEYQAVRQKVTITPAMRNLDLKISRKTDLRKQGWVTADTHVHFLSPSTAVLEAQAEGLNLVNLLATQWGELFTNVGDLSHGALVSKDRQTMVWMGTENRQHLLGHIGLLGGRGEPVFPMAADGPNETWIGGPLWSTMAEWADECRKREGVTIGVHFPNPMGELPADIVLGKIDAVELYPAGNGGFKTLGYNEWYRYLNCGYRLTVVGGTDKMSAGTPLGGNRTYAFLGNEEFTFANWAKALRSGQTFATTGPLLFLLADGHPPGDDIQLRAGGGSIEVQVSATSYVPFHRIEVIYNGHVIASKDAVSGTREMTLRERVKLPGPGWLAARCSSQFGRTTAWRFGINAHTSPVYVRTPGQELFSNPAAAYMLTLIEGAQTYVNRLAVRPGEERFRKILKVFEDAHSQLAARIREHQG